MSRTLKSVIVRIYFSAKTKAELEKRQAEILNKLDEYKDLMEKVFGSGSCYILSVRPVGGVEL